MNLNRPSAKCTHPGCPIILILVHGANLPATCWEHTKGTR
jgi:hypothetical protein